MTFDLDLSAVAPAIARTSTKEMISIEVRDGRTYVKINSSSLGIILSCPRKSQYTLDRGLKSNSESPATLFGSAIHAALEVFYSAPRAERRIPRDFVTRSNALIDGGEYDQNELLFRAIAKFCEKAQPLRDLVDSDKRSLPGGVWTLQNYFETYIDDPFEVLCDADGPITERVAEAVLYEDEKLTIILFGTIDVVLENKQTGVILPTDHKTSSIVGNDFYNRLKPNHQYTGYVYLAQKVLGIRCDGFMVNCLQVKPKPKTARGSAPHFPRQVTTRSEDDIAEFTDSVVEAVRSYLRWKESGVWPIGDVNACTMYGSCQFLDVCAAPKTIREDIIEAKFNARA